MMRLRDDEDRSLAWELTKDQTTVVRLVLHVVAIVVITFGVSISVVVGCFLHYLSLYDFSSTTYEQSSTVEATSDDGGDANAIVNNQGEVLINGESSR